ncbi:fasciclin domain-containing protein [Rhizobium sp. CRIBSB]|nr:fasciclin domain-containing protein [Rhizobium sp. CRIBSB]
MTLSRLALASAAVATLALMPGTFSPAAAHDRSAHKADHHRTSQTLVAIAAGNEDFSTLVTAVQSAGLVQTLNSAGPFTVFAPTNAAFSELPEGTVASLLRPAQRDQLTQILTYHVVPGRISAADLTTAVRVGGGSATLTTVEGGQLTVTARHGGLTLTDGAGNRINVTAADIPASNGIIHVLDGVLIPH